MHATLTPPEFSKESTVFEETPRALTPRLMVVGVIGVLALGLAVLIYSRQPVGTQSQTQSWGRVGGFFQGSGSSATEEPKTRPSDILLSTSSPYDTIFHVPVQTSDTQTESAVDNIQDLLQALVGPRASTSSSQESSPGIDVYSFIPRGLISLSQTSTQRSDKQQALYEYGNQLGAQLLGFEDTHSGMAEILKNAREDQGNSEKQEAALRIAEDYVRLAEELETISTVPSEARALHASFAAAHRTLGEALPRVIRAREEEAFVSAITSYNKTVEAYAEHYLSLVTLFDVSDIRFSASDPGHVFSFSSAPSL